MLMQSADQALGLKPVAETVHSLGIEIAASPNSIWVQHTQVCPAMWNPDFLKIATSEKHMKPYIQKVPRGSRGVAPSQVFHFQSIAVPGGATPSSSNSLNAGPLAAALTLAF